jgi:hypothetical protein
VDEWTVVGRGGHARATPGTLTVRDMNNQQRQGPLALGEQFVYLILSSRSMRLSASLLACPHDIH